MLLTVGTRLGPYEIKSLIGSGGMGEVYRARDTRLERIVAVKILPESFSSDPSRLERFQHEARLLSTLSHPNVLAIYDVGALNGLHYLVSEFLDGHSLREVLAGGVIPRRKVAEYALQICKGLAAAHDKGIIHRDLKPDNIFITQDERVKVLDFGLAKQLSAAAPTEGATLTAGVPTTPGTVMGTVGYMSPEQVRGQQIDHRSDIFSFGAVLYEMISSQRAFQGESTVETMNAILKEDAPEISVSGTQVSPGLDRIMRRCLEKKPEQRFQSASDLAFALEALGGGSTTSEAVLSPISATKDQSPAWIAVGVVALIALAVAAAWFFARHQAYNASFRQISFRPSYIRTARFAPGRTVVYAASINGEPMALFSARTDTFESQPSNLKADLLSVSRSSELVVSLGRVFDTMWTPTGRLAEAPLGGGSTRELLDDVIDADWNKDGTELAVARRVGDHFRLEYPIGKVLYQTAGYVSDLRFSRKDEQIAFIDHEIVGDDRGTVSVIDPQGHRRVLTKDFESIQGLAWSAKDNEIWFSASENAEPNSIRAVDLRGRTRIVAAGPTRIHLQDIDEDGQLLLSTDVVHFQIGIGDRSGSVQDLTPFEYESLGGLSRDGDTVSLNSFDIAGDASYRLYLQRRDGSNPILVGHGMATAFSNDGKWLASVDPAHPENLFLIPTGIGETRTLHAPAGRYYAGASFFPDGKRLLITTVTAGQGPQSGVQQVETGTVHAIGPDDRFVVAHIMNLFPGPSPDGRYCIESDGKGEYWLQSIEGAGARQISAIAADERIINWHTDSDNIFLARNDGANVQVTNLELGSGRRTAWMTFSPPDKTAMTPSTFLLITTDGTHFAYEAHKIFSTLFIANRVQ
jgi:eukaryotic-like serine/threonine-protein kinase